NPFRSRLPQFVTSLHQAMPANLFVLDDERDIFLNAGFLIEPFLDAKVIIGAREACFADQFGCARMILAANAGLTAALRRDPEISVGLRRALQHQPGGLVATLAPRG